MGLLDFTIYIYLSLSLPLCQYPFLCIYIYTYVLKHWYLQIFVCFYFVLHACGSKYLQMPNAHTHTYIICIYIYLSWPFPAASLKTMINQKYEKM